MKNAKVVCVVVVYMVIVYVLDAIILDLTDGLLITIPQVLPLGSYVATVYLYLISVLSISIVSFIGGFISWVSLKMVRLGAIVYIALDCLISIKQYIFVSLQVFKQFPFLVPTVMLVSHAMILVLALVLSKWLCLKGRNLREKLRKNP